MFPLVSSSSDTLPINTECSHEFLGVLLEKFFTQILGKDITVIFF
jgi:hypothetical protein